MDLSTEHLDEDDECSIFSVDSKAPLLIDDEYFNNTSPQEELISNRFRNHDGRQGISGSSWAAYINVTCLIAGTGILGMPYVINKGNWIGITLVALLMLMTQYTRRNLDNLVTVHFNVHIETRIWICIAAALISIPFILMKSLKDVFFLSIFGTLSTLFSVIAVAALSCRDFTDVLTYYDSCSHNLYKFPATFAAISLTYGGNSLFPSIERNMRRRKDWNKVVTAASLTCTIMYLIVAFSGYYVFGDCKVVHTNNHEGPIVTIATVFITIDMLLTAPILLTSFASEAEEFLKITREHVSSISEFLLRVLFRLCIVVGCVIVAIFVPLFGDFMALFGTLAMYCLVFIFPVIFYMKLFGWNKLSFLELIFDLFIVFVGFAVYLIGTIDAIHSLLRDFQSRCSHVPD
ncbi:transmembrane amino acid transporter protein [Gigaspora rosea]|uniref:Transmembrane amino acid transporter protein n=1 Tax=Gigaspora rosea TaxID=44941 RepID=A0A397V0U1_9GLOM|nr:transmembrane amino acid transporter protein [Gigaspora rosea]